MKDLTLDVILGHNVLDMYEVVIDYTAHEVFLGKDKWSRLVWCGSSIKKETTTTTSVLRGLHTVSYTHLDVYKRQYVL